MYSYTELKEYFLHRLYANQSLHYVRALVKYNKNQNHNLDWHSKRDINECQQCTVISYTAATCVTALLALPLYLYSRKRTRGTVRLPNNTQAYNQLFNRANITQHTHNVEQPLLSMQRLQPAVRRPRRLGNTGIAALVVFPILYSMSGVAVDDHCYYNLLENKTSDIARKAQKLYKQSQASYLGAIQRQNALNNISYNTTQQQSSPIDHMEFTADDTRMTRSE